MAVFDLLQFGPIEVDLWVDRSLLLLSLISYNLDHSKWLCGLVEASFLLSSFGKFEVLSRGLVEASFCSF